MQEERTTISINNFKIESNSKLFIVSSSSVIVTKNSIEIDEDRILELDLSHEWRVCKDTVARFCSYLESNQGLDSCALFLFPAIDPKTRELVVIPLSWNGMGITILIPNSWELSLDSVFNSVMKEEKVFGNSSESELVFLSQEDNRAIFPSYADLIRSAQDALDLYEGAYGYQPFEAEDMVDREPEHVSWIHAKDLAELCCSQAQVPDHPFGLMDACIQRAFRDKILTFRSKKRARIPSLFYHSPYICDPAVYSDIRLQIEVESREETNPRRANIGGCLHRALSHPIFKSELDLEDMVLPFKMMLLYMIRKGIWLPECILRAMLERSFGL